MYSARLVAVEYREGRSRHISEYRRGRPGERQYAAVAGRLDDDFLYKHIFEDTLGVVLLPQACSKLLNLCDSLGVRALDEPCLGKAKPVDRAASAEYVRAGAVAIEDSFEARFVSGPRGRDLGWLELCRRAVPYLAVLAFFGRAFSR